MTTYNEHELRTMAVKMRSEIDSAGIPGRLLLKVAELVDLIDGAADGKVSQEALQAAVDDVNADLECDADRKRRMDAVSLLVDRALEDDDPGAWRDAMLQWLPVLPEDYLRVLMDNYADLLDTAEAMQALALVEMRPATEMRQ